MRRPLPPPPPRPTPTATTIAVMNVNTTHQLSSPSFNSDTMTSIKVVSTGYLVVHSFLVVNIVVQSLCFYNKLNFHIGIELFTHVFKSVAKKITDFAVGFGFTVFWITSAFYLNFGAVGELGWRWW